MVALSRRVVTALTLGCGLSAMLTITQPGWAGTDIGEGAQSVGAVPCVIGHRFELGPIVGGHNRQPTPAEFEARTRELMAWSQRSAGSCSSPPFWSTAAAIALWTRPTIRPSGDGGGN